MRLRARARSSVARRAAVPLVTVQSVRTFSVVVVLLRSSCPQSRLQPTFVVLALLSALSSKVAENQLIVVDGASLASHKTKDLKAALATLNAEKALIMDAGQIDQNLQLAADNLIGVDCLLTDGANVYDILRHDNLIMTTAAVEALRRVSQASLQMRGIRHEPFLYARSPSGRSQSKSLALGAPSNFFVVQL